MKIINNSEGQGLATFLGCSSNQITSLLKFNSGGLKIEKDEEKKIWGFIYCFTINDKKYVGQTIETKCSGLKRRFRAHFKTKIINPYFHNALRKYWKPGCFLIIETHFNTRDKIKSILNEREIFWIAELDTYDPEQKKGWNLQKGGAITKEQIRKTNIKRTLPQTQKDKISASLKGRVKSKLEVEHISKSLTGKIKSEIHKQHLKENHADVTGENNPWYGKGYLQKGENNPNAKAVILISPEGKEYKLSYYSSFCKEHKLTPWCISAILHKKMKKYKGWAARFLNEDEK